MPPDDLGGPPLPDGPIFPQLIIFPEHSPGADLRVTSLGEAECAYSLGMNTSRIQDIRGGPLPTLARLARRAPAYRVTYDDVRSAADVVEEIWSSVW